MGALDEAQQRAIWQLPVSAARQTRVTGKPRCAKYELHTLRDFESNGVIEACVRPLKIRRLGGFRAGSVKTPDLRRLSQMCAHDAAGVRAEEGLSASRRAFDERMEARQRELSCHHVTQRFEHIMLPAEEDLGAPPTPPAAEVLVPDSDEEEDTVDSTPRSHAIPPPNMTPQSLGTFCGAFRWTLTTAKRPVGGTANSNDAFLCSSSRARAILSTVMLVSRLLPQGTSLLRTMP